LLIIIELNINSDNSIYIANQEFTSISIETSEKLNINDFYATVVSNICGLIQDNKGR